MRFLSLSAAAFLAIFSAAAVAAPVSISNSSFEAGAGFWAASDWTNVGVGSDAVVEVQNLPLMGKSGNNYLNLCVTGSNGTPPVSLNALFSGSLGTFQANTQYDLSVAITHSYDWNPSDVMKASIGLATGNTLASIVQLNTYSLRNDGSAGDFISYNQFADKTFSFTTGSLDSVIGQPLHVVLQFSHDGQYFRSVRFDNVRLDAMAVPEPTIAFSTAGALILLARRRRAKKF